MSRVSGFRRAVMLAVGVIAPVAAGYAQEAVQSLEAVRAAAQRFVIEKVPKQEPGAVRLEVGALDPRLRLAPCAAPLKAALPPGATFRARMMVAVSCPDTPGWTVYVPVSIETRIPVLVLRKAAGRGARLTAEDVEVQTRLVSGPGDSYLTDVAELAGRTLKRPLGPGAALTADVMMDDMIVRRGQRVTLLAAIGGIEVRAAGLAMNDAPAAGRVKVQNLTSRRIVEGVVESADVIRITP